MAQLAESPWPALGGYSISVDGVVPIAGGHVNAAWRVVAGAGESYFLQRLNPEVFRDGGAVMHNIVQVTAHLARAVQNLPDAARRALRLELRQDGSSAWQDERGAWWRMFQFIERSRTASRVESPADAYQVGTAFGLFQRQLADYRGPALAETIPRFHDTAARLAALEQTIAEDVAGRAASVGPELALVRARARYAAVLPPLRASGEVAERIAHNDAKSGNVLLDADTGEALAVVDLDTVMPGTLLYDVGDLLRSTASPTDEDERDPGRIGVVPALVAALARGFLGACGRGMTEAERAHFIFAGLLLTFEQGVRFLSDHLAGDRYYRIDRPGQNLDRARAQFRLLESLEAQRGALEATVDRLSHETLA